MNTSYLERVVTYVGADGRMLRWQVKDEDGVAIDLSAIDTATISALIGTLDGTDTAWKIQAQSVTIEGGTSGWINYTPSAAEINIKGDYITQVRFVASSKIDYTEASIIEVKEAYHYTS